MAPNQGSLKRAFNNKSGGHKSRKKQKLRAANTRFEGTHDEVLSQDIRHFRDKYDIKEEGSALETIEPFQEIEVNIREISSTGDGLGTHGDHKGVFVVPFTAPGDRVLCKVVRHDAADSYYMTDFVSVVEASPLRDNNLVRCKYFASCSGCQFQMLPYAEHLKHKRRVVEKAYQNFSGLRAELVPAVEDTIGSPLHYGYRTKLTPHFDGPPGARKAARKGARAQFTEVPPIGFMRKGTRHTLDIEECPIGTPAVQMGLRRERVKVKAQLEKYSKGVTILLRETTELVARNRVADDMLQKGIDEAKEVVYEDYPVGDADGADQSSVYAKTCTTDNNGISTEYVEGFRFENQAGSFFQNNNSILPTFVSYIRNRILGSNKEGTQPSPRKITNLIDAYCGSGLFTVTLSSMFERSIGIDIDGGAIAAARRNAQINGLTPKTSEAVNGTAGKNGDVGGDGEKRVSFIPATASALFSSVSDLDPRATAVVIDPPRKGCDEEFLTQLLHFGPERIVYVSCNVHTQARDIGWLIKAGPDNSAVEDSPVAEGEGSKKAVGKVQYVMESLVGFDFFPQTSHVESVAVLSRRSS